MKPLIFRHLRPIRGWRPARQLRVTYGPIATERLRSFPDLTPLVGFVGALSLLPFVVVALAVGGLLFVCGTLVAIVVRRL